MVPTRPTHIKVQYNRCKIKTGLSYLLFLRNAEGIWIQYRSGSQVKGHAHYSDVSEFRSKGFLAFNILQLNRFLIFAILIKVFYVKAKMLYWLSTYQILLEFKKSAIQMSVNQISAVSYTSYIILDNLIYPAVEAEWSKTLIYQIQVENTVA